MSSNYWYYSLLKTVTRCRRTLRGEGQSEASWSIGGCVELQTAGPKSFRSGNGLPLIAARRLLLVLVSRHFEQFKPLVFVFPCKVVVYKCRDL